MARARALVIGPLGACVGDEVSVRVVEGCSTSDCQGRLPQKMIATISLKDGTPLPLSTPLSSFGGIFRKPLCCDFFVEIVFAREYLRRDWFSRAGSQGSNPLLRVHRVHGREVAIGGGGVS